MSEGAAFPAVAEGESTPGAVAREEAPEVEIEAPVEEARARKELPRPYAPTPEEIAKHRVDHLPYRNWCPECVEGFARERAHRAHEGGERETPLVSCDYLYITPRGVFARDELPEGERSAARRVLVGKGGATQGLCASPASGKYLQHLGLQ